MSTFCSLGGIPMESYEVDQIKKDRHVDSNQRFHGRTLQAERRQSQWQRRRAKTSDRYELGWWNFTATNLETKTGTDS